VIIWIKLGVNKSKYEFKNQGFSVNCNCTCSRHRRFIGFSLQPTVKADSTTNNISADLLIFSSSNHVLIV
jgi:hypothetical protein